MVSLAQLPWRNLRGYPARTAALLVFSSLMAMVLFGGTMVVEGVRQGLRTVESRLGADILVTPADARSEFDAQDFLVRAEPSYFYMDEGTLDRVAAVPGVEAASPQLFLASARASCCSGRYQVIAFDPGSDFTVQPWIDDTDRDVRLGPMDVVVGSNVTVYDEGDFKIFDQSLRVVAQFAPTGSALDNAVYTDFDTARVLIESSLSKGLNKYTDLDPSSVISSVLVRVRAGEDPASVAAAIEEQVPGVAAVTSTAMVGTIARTLDDASRTVIALIAIAWAVGLVMVVLVFVMMIHERRREFATLSAVGAGKRLVSRVIAAEALGVNGIGGLVGVAVSGALLVSFEGLVRQALGSGFVVPSWTTALLLALVSLAATAAVAVVASLVSVGYLRTTSASALLKEGE